MTYKLTKPIIPRDVKYQYSQNYKQLVHNSDEDTIVNNRLHHVRGIKRDGSSDVYGLSIICKVTTQDGWYSEMEIESHRASEVSDVPVMVKHCPICGLRLDCDKIDEIKSKNLWDTIEP